MQNNHQKKKNRKKKKKVAWIFSWGKGVGGLTGRASASESQRKEGSGRRPFPPALFYASRLTEDSQRGRAPSSCLPAQLLREASCQVSPSRCSGCSGLGSGALTLQRQLCLPRPVQFAWREASSCAYGLDGVLHHQHTLTCAPLAVLFRTHCRS